MTDFKDLLKISPGFAREESLRDSREKLEAEPGLVPYAVVGYLAQQLVSTMAENYSVTREQFTRDIGVDPGELTTSQVICCLALLSNALTKLFVEESPSRTETILFLLAEHDVYRTMIDPLADQIRRQR
jgi:hypothetical protein